MLKASTGYDVGRVSPSHPMGSVVSSPNGVRGELRPKTILVYIMAVSERLIIELCTLSGGVVRVVWV